MNFNIKLGIVLITMPSNTNKIWEHIINKNNINLNENISFITSKQIKESKDSWEGKRNQFEPRLLCKFDNRDSRRISLEFD